MTYFSEHRQKQKQCVGRYSKQIFTLSIFSLTKYWKLCLVEWGDTNHTKITLHMQLAPSIPFPAPLYSHCMMQTFMSALQLHQQSLVRWNTESAM
jgi:hypothetical protein